MPGEGQGEGIGGSPSQDTSIHLPVVEWEIYLQLANLEIDVRRKSHPYLNYGDLFDGADSVERPYPPDSEEDEDASPVTAKSYGCTLEMAADRLVLLGFAYQSVRDDYERAREIREGIPRHPEIPIPPDPPFDVLSAAIRQLDIGTITPRHPRRGAGSPARQVAERVAAAVGVCSDGDLARTVDWYEMRFNELDPYTLLQILAQDPRNVDLELIWHPHNEVIYGFLEEEHIQVGEPRRNRFLIVTEGSSDTAIIRRALELTRGHVASFFDFVDMESDYPFTGTGNLHNFYLGLVKIAVQNNVLFIYDNDTEGSLKLAAASQLDAPANMRVMKLPDMDCFRDFLTVGPTGEHRADINGKAVSIECFLDLGWDSTGEPRVRWTGFNRSAADYQGEIEDKTRFVRTFLRLSESELEAYDMSKLATVIESIVVVCAEIAALREEAEWIYAY